MIIRLLTEPQRLVSYFVRPFVPCSQHIERLSFYKEILAGESDNYIHLYASTEDINPVTALQQLSKALLQSMTAIESLTMHNPLLAKTLRGYLMVSIFVNTHEEKTE